MSNLQSNAELLKESTSEVNKSRQWRSLIAYWILGLCNNYGYVVMLTAADDIIKTASDETHGPRNCVYMSTGAVLLADIIPSLTVKSLAPFIPFFIRIRMIICILAAIGGFLIVGYGTNMALSIFGVVCTSFASGLGEVSLLQYSSFYNKKVLSTWSSGTGAAGVIGAISYTALRSLGFHTTCLIMLIVPAFSAISFFIILPSPSDIDSKQNEIQDRVNTEEITNPKEVLIHKVKLIPGLLKYMIPLFTVYLFEYFINQGMFELIKIDNSFVSTADQYHWMQVDYQIGVFVSRSSVNLFHTRHTWIFSVLQFLNVVVFTTEAIYCYMPSFWIVLVLTFWEGLLGGASYVNTFYSISIEANEEDKQFSLACTSFSDSIGITLAGVFAILAHNKICDMPYK